MARILKCVIVLILAVFIACTTVINIRVFATTISDVEQSFVVHEVVPDVIPNAPTSLLQVIYPTGVQVNQGNELAPTQVKDVPTVWWEAAADQYYTVLMTDPDAPSRASPTLREWHHWLVGNVLGTNILSGETLAQYVGAGPSYGTGLHRYVFLVYQQPSKLEFDEPILNNTSSENRHLFSVTKFAEKYNMSGPVAGNLFLAEYDDYVPILLEQLGLL